jgi:hypothetical protein
MGFSVGVRMGPVRVSNKGISAGVSAGPVSYSGFHRWGGRSYSHGGGSRGGYVVAAGPEPGGPFRNWAHFSECLHLAEREHMAKVHAAIAAGTTVPPVPSSAALQAAARRHATPPPKPYTPPTALGSAILASLGCVMFAVALAIPVEVIGLIFGMPMIGIYTAAVLTAFFLLLCLVEDS